MQEFNEGDLVEAVKGETVIRGRAVPHVAGGFAPGECMAALTWYQANGFTVTVIEKAAPKLPTEPGWYSDVDGSVWRLREDEWSLIGMNDVVRDGGGVVLNYTPLTRLESATVTAKKVLDAIRARIGSIDSAYDFQAVATQFGVTE